MNKRNHESAEAARAELVEQGFVDAFSSPGRPTLWAKGKDKRRFAIQHEVYGANERWNIVAYPEPATCQPHELAALNKRDGMDSGELILESDELNWLDGDET